MSDLLLELEASVNDIRTRAGEAKDAAFKNRQQRERALAAYDEATLQNDKEAMKEADELVRTLDADYEFLERQVTTLTEALNTGAGKPQKIAREIKAKRQKEVDANTACFQEKAGELREAARHYLELVVEMGQIYKSGGLMRASFEQAKKYLLPGEQHLTGNLEPGLCDHDGQKGPIYLIAPVQIKRAFTEGRI